MGEIADEILDGIWDSVTGEYLGEGCGFPRTFSEGYVHNPVRGVQKYLENNGLHKREKKKEVVKMFAEQFLMLDYQMVGFDKSCAEIQKVFGEFIKFVKGYKKGAFN